MSIRDQFCKASPLLDDIRRICKHYGLQLNFRKHYCGATEAAQQMLEKMTKDKRRRIRAEDVEPVSLNWEVAVKAVPEIDIEWVANLKTYEIWVSMSPELAARCSNKIAAKVGTDMYDALHGQGSYFFSILGPYCMQEFNARQRRFFSMYDGCGAPNFPSIVGDIKRAGLELCESLSGHKLAYANGCQTTHAYRYGGAQWDWTELFDIPEFDSYDSWKMQMAIRGEKVAE